MLEKLRVVFEIDQCSNQLRPFVRLHDRIPNTITLAFVINAPTRKRTELLGYADGRHGHSGKTETTIFIERNCCKNKASILSREMIEG